jgi:uncharacterized protein
MKEVIDMDLNLITELAHKNMAKRKAHSHREKGYVFYHCQRVAKMSLNLRKIIIPDDSNLDDVIYVGALFHDVAKGIEPHNERGAVLVREILKDACTEDDISAISEVVQKHNERMISNIPTHIKIVQDADVLDHFGSMEIWLKFMYSAYENETAFDALALWNSDEFLSYNKDSRQSLNFDVSRELFDKKALFHRQFQERFAVEADGALL